MQRVRPVLFLLVAGCVSQAPTDSGVGEVRALAAAFDPAQLVVKVGENVTWRVASDNHHTVTVADPQGPGTRTLADSGDLEPGQAYRFAFSDPGTYHVYCRYHSQGGQGIYDAQEMTMTVMVEAGDAAT